MTTLFHIGPKGFNVGNHAIGVGMKHFIQGAFGRVVNLVSIPATSRYEVNRRAGLTAATVHEINQFGDGVIVGGGNLYENGELEVDVNALDALEVPLLLFSLSWGRIYNRVGELVRRTDAMPDALIRAVNDRSGRSLARDRATYDHLRSIGVEGVELGGCPTLFLSEIAERLPTLPASDRRLALLSVRNPSLMNIAVSAQSRVHGDVASLVRWLSEEGFDDVRLLCHDHRDIPFAASFPGVEWLYIDDVMTYLSLLDSSSLNVTYRLHSALPCLSFGRPFIKLSYDERSLSLMETVGLGEWNIDIVKEPDVVGAVQARFRSLDRLSSLREEARPLWETQRKTMQSAFDAFAADVEDQRGAVDRRTDR